LRKILGVYSLGISSRNYSKQSLYGICIIQLQSTRIAESVELQNFCLLGKIKHSRGGNECRVTRASLWLRFMS